VSALASSFAVMASTTTPTSTTVDRSVTATASIRTSNDVTSTQAHHDDHFSPAWVASITTLKSDLAEAQVDHDAAVQIDRSARALMRAEAPYASAVVGVMRLLLALPLLHPRYESLYTECAAAFRSTVAALALASTPLGAGPLLEVLPVFIRAVHAEVTPRLLEADRRAFLFVLSLLVGASDDADARALATTAATVTTTTTTAAGGGGGGGGSGGGGSSAIGVITPRSIGGLGASTIAATSTSSASTAGAGSHRQARAAHYANTGKRVTSAVSQHVTAGGDISGGVKTLRDRTTALERAIGSASVAEELLRMLLDPVPSFVSEALDAFFRPAVLDAHHRKEILFNTVFRHHGSSAHTTTSTTAAMMATVAAVGVGAESSTLAMGSGGGSVLSAGAAVGGLLTSGAVVADVAGGSRGGRLHSPAPSQRVIGGAPRDSATAGHSSPLGIRGGVGTSSGLNRGSVAASGCSVLGSSTHQPWLDVLHYHIIPKDTDTLVSNERFFFSAHVFFRFIFPTFSNAFFSSSCFVQ
jgi:hypothetical protein